MIIHGQSKKALKKKDCTKVDLDYNKPLTEDELFQAYKEVIAHPKPAPRKKRGPKWLKRTGMKKTVTSDFKRALTRLDTVYSKFIRERDSISEGVNKCCTCGKIKRNLNRQIHCGHFQKRANMATRYDEQNTHAQCHKCNSFEGGRDFEFGLYIDKKYGAGTAEKLYIKAKTLKKYSVIELDELTKYYRNKLKGE